MKIQAVAKRPFTNNRRLREETDQKFLMMTIFTLVVIGGGLIALIYGAQALLTALPCLLGGAGLILIPWWLLTALEKWRNHLEKSEMTAMDSKQKGENENE